MLYFLHELDFVGSRLFYYLSSRAAMAFIISMLIATFFGKKIIRFLQKKQIGETVRDLGLEGQYEKRGTPTMGGIIIIISILIPTLLFANILNIYVVLMVITTIWLGMIGFIDDYIKLVKKNKEGLSGKYKIIGQVTLGLIIGLSLYFNDSAVIRNKVEIDKEFNYKQFVDSHKNLHDSIQIIFETKREQLKTKKLHISQLSPEIIGSEKVKNNTKIFIVIEEKSTKTTIPFFKNNEFDYAYLVGFLGEHAQKVAWIVFVIIVIFITTAVSNGANITDGLDGLTAGTSAIIGSTLGIFAYLSGNAIFSDYLKIMYIPNIGELVIFASALIGSLAGFLWYNSFPAQVFMGDTGSLTLGGLIAVFAVIVRKELMIPIICGIFLVENISVMMQVGYFKYTKKRFGEGKRIFKMAPLHHHYQKLGYPEPKIVTRFWIVTIILAVISILTLKLR